MFNKNIFLVLITIFTYLNFITCTTGENLSISKKTGDTVTSISTSISSEDEGDLGSIIQFVVDKYSVLDQKIRDSLEFVDDDCCNCDDSHPTKIIICRRHSKQIDFWKKLFSNDKESTCTGRKTKKSIYLSDKSFYNISVGVFCKYFYFYSSDDCKDGSAVKKCGCKILKNATTECMEVCLCKKHFEIWDDCNKSIALESLRVWLSRPGHEWIK